MKTLTFFLLFVIAALAAQGDNDGIHPGEWLPAPDAFVWPEKPVNAPEFRTKSAQLERLPMSHAFQKKSQKTPRQAIRLAEERKRDYFRRQEL